METIVLRHLRHPISLRCCCSIINVTSLQLNDKRPEVMHMGEAVVWNTCEMCWCFCYRRSRLHDMSRGLKHFMWSEIEIAANLFWLAGAVVTTLVTHSFSVRPICSHRGDSLAKTSFSPFSCSPGWWMTSRSLSDDCLAVWRRDTLTTSAAFWKSFKQEALRAATTNCDSLS